jgi:hypothetical protein
VIVCFSFLFKRERTRFCNFSDQFSVLFTQRQQLHGRCCCDEEEIFDDHNGGSRSILANDDVSDQPTGGNGKDGNTGESESVERVGVGENNLCTGDREHDD